MQSLLNFPLGRGPQFLLQHFSSVQRLCALLSSETKSQHSRYTEGGKQTQPHEGSIRQQNQNASHMSSDQSFSLWASSRTLPLGKLEFLAFGESTVSVRLLLHSHIAGLEFYSFQFCHNIATGSFALCFQNSVIIASLFSLCHVSLCLLFFNPLYITLLGFANLQQNWLGVSNVPFIHKLAQFLYGLRHVSSVYFYECSILKIQ